MWYPVGVAGPRYLWQFCPLWIRNMGVGIGQQQGTKLEVGFSLCFTRLFALFALSKFSSGGVFPTTLSKVQEVNVQGK